MDTNKKPVTAEEWKSNAETFYIYFKNEINGLHERLDHFATVDPKDEDRIFGLEKATVNLKNLQEEVQDAASWIPAHDQRTYSEGIKSVLEKLQKVKEGPAGTTKKRFAFKGGKKVTSAATISPAVSASTSSEFLNEASGFSVSSRLQDTPQEGVNNEEGIFKARAALQAQERERADTLSEIHETVIPEAKEKRTRASSFSQTTTTELNDHNRQHITIPAGPQRAMQTGHFHHNERAILDLAPGGKTGAPFSNVKIHDCHESLIIAGTTTGPAHITNVKRSTIVVACHQFRMHSCQDVDVYLFSKTRPIIEDCTNVRFAPLPNFYLEREGVMNEGISGENMWNKVDDFKWLKPEASPHWREVPEEERIKEEVWRDVLPGSIRIGREDVLLATGVVGKKESVPELGY